MKGDNGDPKACLLHVLTNFCIEPNHLSRLDHQGRFILQVVSWIDGCIGLNILYFFLGEFRPLPIIAVEA